MHLRESAHRTGSGEEEVSRASAPSRTASEDGSQPETIAKPVKVETLPVPPIGFRFREILFRFTARLRSSVATLIVLLVHAVDGVAESRFGRPSTGPILVATKVVKQRSLGTRGAVVSQLSLPFVCHSIQAQIRRNPACQVARGI